MTPVRSLPAAQWNTAGESDAASVVTTLAMAGAAIGAHGIMVEVHPEPEKALSDGPQSLTFDDFRDLMGALART